MPTDADVTTKTEAVGVFKDATSLEAAIDELLSSGFDRAELSLLAGEDVVQQKLGHMYDKVKELEDDPSVPRVAYVPTESIGGFEGGLIGGLMYVGAVAAVGAVVATGGALATVIAAAGVAGGAGGAIGVALAKLIEKHHADHLQTQIDHGGLLLWVRTRDATHENQAQEILRRHSAADVHVHKLAHAS
ncbi:MAG: hypothetical protein QNJ92_15000 [Alphaproteobacteria bacterium]|nr:hypothetical protein [Alphaproteobacteria bacterium]